jgi:hypothetical protein
MEEAKLEQLYGEIRGLEARRAELDAERTKSEQDLLAAASVTGLQLAELDAFQRFSAAERGRLERQRVECGQRIAAQIQVVAAKRRDIRLLERLKEDRLNAWNADLVREIDAQADETYLAKWKPGAGPA